MSKVAYHVIATALEYEAKFQKAVESEKYDRLSNLDSASPDLDRTQSDPYTLQLKLNFTDPNICLKMIGRINKQLNFAEVFTHLFNPGKDYLFLLKSQCCDGQNVAELAREFQIVANLCPSKRLPARHIFISLDRTEQEFSKDLKIDIVNMIIQKMGFNSCQYIALELNLYDLYYSEDRSLSGIHIVANAVNLQGRKIADFKDVRRLKEVLNEIQLSLDIASNTHI